MSYSYQFRLKIIKLVTEQNYGIREVAKLHQIYWLKAFRESGLDGVKSPYTNLQTPKIVKPKMKKKDIETPETTDFSPKAFKILKKFRKIPLISTFYCLYLFITVFSVFTIFKQQYNQLFRRLVFACCLKVYFLIKKQEKKTMVKLAKPLSDKALKALKATGKNVTLYDGQGLQIMANIHGRKTWRFTYHFDGKRKLLTLGNYPDISLALARELASQKRALLARGIDPQEHTKEQRRERERNITVKELAILWHTKNHSVIN